METTTERKRPHPLSRNEYEEDYDMDYDRKRKRKPESSRKDFFAKRKRYEKKRFGKHEYQEMMNKLAKEKEKKHAALQFAIQRNIELHEMSQEFASMIELYKNIEKTFGLNKPVQPDMSYGAHTRRNKIN